jgi:hypothetical protein
MEQLHAVFKSGAYYGCTCHYQAATSITSIPLHLAHIFMKAGGTILLITFIALLLC